MRRLETSRLIRIYTVCNSGFDFRLKLLFESVGMSKFKNGRIYFKTSGMKWLKYHLFTTRVTLFFHLSHYSEQSCLLFFVRLFFVLLLFFNEDVKSYYAFVGCNPPDSRNDWIYSIRVYPCGHITFIQLQINVDSTS